MTTATPGAPPGAESAPGADSTTPSSSGEPGGTAPGAGLRALLRRTGPGARPRAARATDAATASEHCDLCAAQVPGSHPHLLDMQSGEVQCTCGPCALLFGQSTAGGRRYKPLPGRRIELRSAPVGAMLWARLGVPVELAFFVRDGDTGEVGARYPSPLGVTRSSVRPEAWEELTRGYPELAQLADDVEALLVHRTGGEAGDRHWIVPLDDCYRLSAVVRTHWRGLSGGPDVREHIDAFFAGLAGAPPAADEPRSQHV